MSRRVFGSGAIIACLVAAFAATACGDDDSEFTGDSGTDSGSDADTDTDTDTSTDTDADTDTDTTLPDFCLGQGDFTFCSFDTTTPFGVDYWYDICVDGACVSPGSCDDNACNAPGPHFAPPPASTAGIEYERYAPLADPEEYVVEDAATGLMWQGCTAGQSGVDCEIGSASALVWAEALSYCDSLNWAGYDDWYLPDHFELQSIVDYGGHLPALNAEIFPVPAYPTGWASSSYQPEPSTYAYWVDFDYGWLYADPKDLTRGARCVRRGPVVVPERYERYEPITGSGEWVVEDSISGITWQGCLAGKSGDACSGDAETFRWIDAVAYCSDLTWGEYSDWFLPDIKDLESMFDTRFNGGGAPAVDTTLFPGIETDSGWTWSSTACDRNRSLAWGAHTESGGMIDIAKGFHYAARCARPEEDVDTEGEPDPHSPMTDCDGGKLDPDTSLCWQDPPIESYVGGESAVCSALGGGWRAPTIQELLSLIRGHDVSGCGLSDPDCLAEDPCWTGCPWGPAHEGTGDWGCYWDSGFTTVCTQLLSSSPAPDDPDGQNWLVDFYWGGPTLPPWYEVPYSLRCVRDEI